MAPSSTFARARESFPSPSPDRPYVADFACMAARLIIEVDGSQHGDIAVKARDDVRTQWLEREGYRVIRFWNNDLTGNMQGVLEVIHAAIHGSRDSDAVMIKHKRRSKLD
jgi:very-short-patch-repair endonuclease